MGKAGCSLFGLVILGWVLWVWGASDPNVAGTILFGLLIGVAAISLTTWRQKSRAKGGYAAMARSLSWLSDHLPNQNNSVLVLNKDEEFIYKLQGVGLTEYRSTGSSYSGGSQGVSFRVMNGVYYRVGANRGSIQRNPETLQVTDIGDATFTNQRIIFVGQKTNHQWDFDKLLDVHMEPNGSSVSIAVSGTAKNAGLTWTSSTDIPPGVLTAIAHDYFTSGVEAARKRCTDTAALFDRMAKGEKIATSA